MLNKYRPVVLSILELGYAASIALSLAVACIFGA